MLELTKKPPIEEFAVICPSDKYQEVIQALSHCGCTIYPLSEAPVAPEKVLDMSPGARLKGARHKEGLTQLELAQKTGISRRHISDMENNRRPIGKKNAQKIGEVVNVEYQIFL